MKDEMSSKQAFEVLIMDLNAQIGEATKDRDEKAEAKASNLEAKAQAFASRQQLRTEEIAAIEKAIEIISSGAVSGAADKHLPAFLQKSSFAQLRSQGRSPSQAQV